MAASLALICLLAFAPHELVPVLEKYKNEETFILTQKLKATTLHGQMPFINVNFGANKAYLENSKNRAR